LQFQVDHKLRKHNFGYLIQTHNLQQSRHILLIDILKKKFYSLLQFDQMVYRQGNDIYQYRNVGGLHAFEKGSSSVDILYPECNFCNNLSPHYLMPYFVVLFAEIALWPSVCFFIAESCFRCEVVTLD